MLVNTVQNTLSTAVSSGVLTQTLYNVSAQAGVTRFASNRVRVTGVSFEAHISRGGSDVSAKDAEESLSFFGSRSGVMVMVGGTVTLLILAGIAYKLFFAKASRAALYEVKEAAADVEMEKKGAEKAVHHRVVH